MQKKLILAGCCLLAATALTAQNKVKGTYGYLYCHMSDRGEFTAYAVSRDGMNYQDILNGDAIMDPEEHARIEGGQRDADDACDDSCKQRFLLIFPMDQARRTDACGARNRRARRRTPPA